MNYEAALAHALESPPKSGWDTEQKLMIELMIKYFMRVERDDLS